MTSDMERPALIACNQLMPERSRPHREVHVYHACCAALSFGQISTLNASHPASVCEGRSVYEGGVEAEGGVRALRLPRYATRRHCNPESWMDMKAYTPQGKMFAVMRSKHAGADVDLVSLGRSGGFPRRPERNGSGCCPDLSLSTN